MIQLAFFWGYFFLKNYKHRPAAGDFAPGSCLWYIWVLHKFSQLCRLNETVFEQKFWILVRANPLAKPRLRALAS